MSIPIAIGSSPAKSRQSWAKSWWRRSPIIVMEISQCQRVVVEWGDLCCKQDSFSSGGGNHWGVLGPITSTTVPAIRFFPMNRPSTRWFTFQISNRCSVEFRRDGTAGAAGITPIVRGMMVSFRRWGCEEERVVFAQKSKSGRVPRVAVGRLRWRRLLTATIWRGSGTKICYGDWGQLGKKKASTSNNWRNSGTSTAYWFTDTTADFGYDAAITFSVGCSGCCTTYWRKGTCNALVSSKTVLKYYGFVFLWKVFQVLLS